MSNQTTESHPHDHSLALAKEVKDLAQEIGRLKKMDFMQVFNHPVKFLWYSFLKGLMVGLGSVLGASVLVAIVIYLLAQVRLVPILGDLVQDVINQIQSEQPINSPKNITK
jgi:hypothetical protein